MATFTVTTLDDEAFDSGNLTDETNDGAGLSLREALALVSDGDVIEFDAGLAGGALNLSLGTLTIANSIAIDGDVNGDDIADITISGDANGDDATTNDTNGNVITDVLNNANAADNARVLEVLAGTVTLDAVVLTGGYAPRTPYVSGVDVDDGGGLLIHESADVYIQNSSIAGNYAGYGGGIMNRGDLSIENTNISHNQADLSGGGVFSGGSGYSSNFSAVASNFSHNHAALGGGIINSLGDVMTLDTVSVTDNVVTDAVRGGGGINNAGLATLYSVEIADNSITGGVNAHGGGFYNSLTGNAKIYNSLLANNYAEYDGGGFYANFNSSAARLVNVTITGNSAGGNGGGVADKDSTSVDLLSSTVTGNYAAGNGGGLYIGYFDASTVTNSIIAGNSALGDGDDLDGQTSASLQLNGVNILGSAPTGFEIYGYNASDDIILGVGNS